MSCLVLSASNQCTNVLYNARNTPQVPVLIMKCLMLLLFIQPLVIATDVAAREWTRNWSALQAIQTTPENAWVTDLLNGTMAYKFYLPETQLRKGMVYDGTNHRLRRVLRNLATGEQPVKIGVVGGSISWGHGASIRGETDWFAWLVHALNATFPQAKLSARNGCVPGAPSSYMVLCLDLAMDQDVDLVFVEYIVNDGFSEMVINHRTATYERLLRRILSLPHNPAVVLVQVTAHGVTFDMYQTGHRRYHITPEDLYGALTSYYDVQWLSFRAATYRTAMFVPEAGLLYPELMAGDLVHLADLGHRVVADLAMWLMQETAIGLLLRPFDDEDRKLLKEPLPIPMYAGNNHPTKAMCLYQDDFAPLMMESHGFEYINEGTDAKPKKGFVATEPGSTLKIRVNLVLPGMPNVSSVPVRIAHLQSYELMGVATASCESGCVCPPVQFDGHHNIRVSQVHLAVLYATPHPECVIVVTVEQKSSSQGHKVKISGLMLAEVYTGYDPFGDMRDPTNAFMTP